MAQQALGDSRLDGGESPAVLYIINNPAWGIRRHIGLYSCGCPRPETEKGPVRCRRRSTSTGCQLDLIESAAEEQDAPAPITPKERKRTGRRAVQGERFTAWFAKLAQRAARLQANNDCSTEEAFLRALADDYRKGRILIPDPGEQPPDDNQTPAGETGTDTPAADTPEQQESIDVIENRLLTKKRFDLIENNPVNEQPFDLIEAAPPTATPASEDIFDLIDKTKPFAATNAQEGVTPPNGANDESTRSPAIYSSRTG